MREQNKGRPTCGASQAAECTALNRECSANDSATQAPRDAAAVFIGNAMRGLRRVVALRLRGDAQTKSLHEAKRARDAVDSAVWALEYEAGLRERGEA